MEWENHTFPCAIREVYGDTDRPLRQLEGMETHLAEASKDAQKRVHLLVYVFMNQQVGINLQGKKNLNGANFFTSMIFEQEIYADLRKQNGKE